MLAMAQKRRTVNVQADLVDAAVRAYEENQSTEAKIVSPTPTVAQLTEGAFRLLTDFLNGRLFYSEDLDEAAAGGYQRALHTFTVDIARFLTEQSPVIFGRRVRAKALVVTDRRPRALGLEFFNDDNDLIGKWYLLSPPEDEGDQA